MDQHVPEQTPHSVRLPFQRRDVTLLLGGALWWACHYALLWNAGIRAMFTVANGPDLRFLCTLAATVVTLAAVFAFARARPSAQLAGGRAPFFAYAALTAAALGLMAACSAGVVPQAAGLTGAVLSGVGNSLALVLYGELHARLVRSLEPLAFAAEMGTGALVSLLLLRLPLAAWGVASALAAVAAAACFLAFRRAALADPAACPCEQPAPVVVDITFAQLLVLCVLTGLAYGLMCTFMGGMATGGVAGGFGPEQLGSLLCAVVLVAVWALQGRASVFDQCLFATVPFVATGMLLVSLQGVAASVAATVNTCGFACFFALLWYFAAIMAASGRGRGLTARMALLLAVSQAFQLLGALVPAPFANVFSSILMYLIFATTLLIFWRDRGRIPGTAPAPAERPDAASGEPDAQARARWERDFGLSPREVQVAELLVRRTPYRQIAEALDVSENTVKTHARNIYKKADVASREELLTRLADDADTLR